MEIRQFDDADRDDVIGLWERCDLTRPWNDPHLDIDRKVAHDPHGFLVGEVGGRIVATAMYGYDGHRGSVNYLGIDPGVRDGGLGRRLMAEIEERLLAVGCPKVNLLVRSDNDGVVDFYTRLGYAHDPTSQLGKRLIDDGPTP
ncbi:MAG: GNAT family acetyltransferase [Actinomycetota bacterium]